MLLLLSVLIPIAVMSTEITYEEILFVPWGDEQGELGIVSAPGGNYGPNSFYVKDNRVVILDDQHQKLNYYAAGYFDFSQHLPFKGIDQFYFISESNMWLLAHNTAYHYVKKDIKDKFTVQNSRHLISNMIPKPDSESIQFIVNHSSRLIEDSNKKGAHILSKGIPLSDENETIRIIRQSLDRCDVYFGTTFSFSLDFQSLALSRYLGKSPANNLYLYIEEYRDDNPYRVNRKVILVNRKGIILAEIYIPRLTHHFMFSEFYVDENGVLYKMISAREGIYITSWTPKNEEISSVYSNRGMPKSENIYFYPDSLLEDYHYSDPSSDSPDSGDLLLPTTGTYFKDFGKSNHISSLTSVTPDEAISIAETYINHIWTARSENIKATAGHDLAGKAVQTPSWVEIGENNIFPYRWGGSETLENFDAGLLSNKYAGDIATSDVSYYSVGVDCSGYVSRCWKLGTHYSTRMMNSTPSLFQFHNSWEEIQPGDALHKVGHVRLHIARNEDGSIFAIESTGNGWRVRYSNFTLSELAAYRPMYYTNMNGTPGIVPRAILSGILATESGIKVSWRSGVDPNLFGGYQVWESIDGADWAILGDGEPLPPDSENYTIDKETAWRSSFFIRALSSDGSTTGLSSDSYSASNTGDKKILIVDGFDRMSSYTKPYHDFVSQLAEHFKNSKIQISSIDNDKLSELPQGLILYDAVFWILGDESTADETFSLTEQNYIKEYLQKGGNLFVSGSEIAWDLDNKGILSDKDFINNYLKVAYYLDDAKNYSIKGKSGSVYSDLAFSYDNGNGGIYEEDYPDVFTPVNGGETVLQYGNNLTAAVYFEGMFPGGSKAGRVFTMGFPFETILLANAQKELLTLVSEQFDIEMMTNEPNLEIIEKFRLYPNYPNPFNALTQLDFYLPGDRNLICTVFDINGREVFQENWGQIPAGRHVRNLELDQFSSGIYFYEINTVDWQVHGKLTLLK